MNTPKDLARAITIIENRSNGYESILTSLPFSSIPVIGITGPPGAGKSTLVDALIGKIISQNKKVGVLCVDPSSPFTLGALLGDRIRMSEWYNHPSVFIRSLATRGSLGGLHPMIIEITDVMKTAGFHYIIVETVGVGQSEIEIAGLADVTVVVVVPEAGDEVQTMKAGLMEIADVFVVNKSDRPDADLFVKNLRTISHHNNVAVIKTIATFKEGVDELYTAITSKIKQVNNSGKKYQLLAEKAYHLIQQNKMTGINKQQLADEITTLGGSFNLYQFVEKYY
jgi:LAO/AO transport system kinase